jgi:hypothetical protein
MESVIDDNEREKLIIPSYRENENDLKFIKEKIMRRAKTNQLPSENYLNSERSNNKK